MGCVPCWKKKDVMTSLDKKPKDNLNPINPSQPEVDPNLCLKLANVVCQIHKQADLPKYNYKCFLLFSDEELKQHTPMQTEVLAKFEDKLRHDPTAYLDKREKGDLLLLSVCIPDIADLEVHLETAFREIEAKNADTLILLLENSLGDGKKFLSNGNALDVFVSTFIEFCKRQQYLQMVDIVTDTEVDLAKELRYKICA